MAYFGAGVYGDRPDVGFLPTEAPEVLDDAQSDPEEEQVEQHVLLPRVAKRRRFATFADETCWAFLETLYRLDLPVLDYVEPGLGSAPFLTVPPRVFPF